MLRLENVPLGELDLKSLEHPAVSGSRNGEVLRSVDANDLAGESIHRRGSDDVDLARSDLLSRHVGDDAVT